ncbi:MAG: ParB/RepB/Spo0J family partition protein [Clostridiaceae bacterium]|nr:ParB/RepB/Spo0J family partition protein [Clostridiaceae bacterium]
MVKIKIKDIKPFVNHPFHVNEDESLIELTQSIKENGLLNPVVLRSKDKGYEMISGHRRLKAMVILGEENIEAIIKELSDEEAIVFMVDSNLQREKILPSEKAFAYKMKLEANKKNINKTSCPEVTKIKTTSTTDKLFEDSKRQVYRYIRLTHLIPELLQLVDDSVKNEKKKFLTMGIKPAVELSYLNKDEQELVYSEIVYEDLTPSHAQAIKIKELSKQKKLNGDSLEKILSEKKGNQNEKITFNKEKIESVLPNEIVNRDKRYVEKYIIDAIKQYKEREIERGDAYDLDM